MITEKQYTEFVLSKEIADYDNIVFTNLDKLSLHFVLQSAVEISHKLDNIKRKFYGKDIDIFDFDTHELTEANIKYNHIVLSKQNKRLLHALLGIATEALEDLENVFKILNNENLDIVNLIEESGDLLFYQTLKNDVLGINFDKICESNISKLNKRYKKEFTTNEALNRDIKAERTILENNL